MSNDKYNSREERLKKARESKNTPKVKNKKSPKSKWKIFFLTLLGLFVTCVAIGIVTFFVLIKDAPKLDETLLKDPLSSRIYDINGKLVTEVGKEYRENITYDEIPKVLEEAVLAIEDNRFYQHKGIDIKRTAAAVLGVFNSGLGGQGGSTITQQVVKRSFLTPEKTIKRKVQEWYLAYQLEQRKSKHEILEIYLNKIYYANGIYGVKKASEYYFDKELKDLTVEEAALLAGIPQRPSAYDPFTNPKLAQERRDIVLGAMEKNGYITKTQLQKSLAIDVKKMVVADKGNPLQEDSKYQHYINEVINELADMSDNKLNIYTDGLEIYTSLDVHAQQTVEDILNTDEYIDYPNDRLQAGVVLMDAKTGEIRAIGGGRNNETARGFNYATNIKRQPGSVIKPILDYGPAVEYLKWGTGRPMMDEPYSYSSGQVVRNWDNKYMGEMTMRKALSLSRNIPAIQAFKAVGNDKALEFANGLGLDLKNAPESYAIGGFDGVEDYMSPLKLAGAYGAFANNGVYNKPHTIKKVVLADGREIKSSQFLPKPTQAMKDYTAYMITDVLRTTVNSGTATYARVPGFDVAGKTGQTNFSTEEINKYGFPSDSIKDSWFAGYTPELVGAVWTGYEKTTSENYFRNGAGQTPIAQKIFRALMREVATDTSRFQKPSSVAQANGELYVRGTEPDEPIIKVESPKNLKATFNKDSNSIDLNWDYRGKNAENVVFEVSYTVDGKEQKLLQSSTAKHATLTNVKPGSTYVFTVTAMFENEKGKPVSVTVAVPIVEVVPPPTDDNDNDNDSDGDNDNDGDGSTPDIPGTTPPGGGTTPPGGGTTPPGGGTTPPGGGTTPPGGGTTPPGGGTTPPGGETTPPEGGTTSPNTNNQSASFQQPGENQP